MHISQDRSLHTESLISDNNDDDQDNKTTMEANVYYGFSNVTEYTFIKFHLFALKGETKINKR